MAKLLNASYVIIVPCLITVQLVEVRDRKRSQYLKAHFKVSNILRSYLPYFDACIQKKTTIKSVPIRAAVTDGNANEKNNLRKSLGPDKLYTLDAGYGQYKLFEEVKGKKEETGRQWAEVCFVPAALGYSKKGPEYRYLATREEMKQEELPA